MPGLGDLSLYKKEGYGSDHGAPSAFLPQFLAGRTFPKLHVRVSGQRVSKVYSRCVTDQESGHCLALPVSAVIHTGDKVEKSLSCGRPWTQPASPAWRHGGF